MTFRYFSFGGGVQSTAALVLAARGALDYDRFWFANVGDDSENPDTIVYVREIAMPYAAAHGLELRTITPQRAKQPVTLYQDVLRTDARAVVIPTHNRFGRMGIRACTKHYKAIPLAREARKYGVRKKTPATVGLGISYDEVRRMNVSRIAWQVFDYPLIDLRLTRADCMRIIADAGLPIPPKSSCWFCPFHSLADWRAMQADQPSLFMNAVVFEYDINAKQTRNGKTGVYLSGAGMPLDRAFAYGQAALNLDDGDVCESGYCMT
jgi:hypothetical protein